MEVLQTMLHMVTNITYITYINGVFEICSNNILNIYLICRRKKEKYAKLCTNRRH